MCVFWQRLNEKARSVIDLQPTGLAFGRSKFWFLLYKSIIILVNYKPLGRI